MSILGTVFGSWPTDEALAKETAQRRPFRCSTCKSQLDFDNNCLVGLP